MSENHYNLGTQENKSKSFIAALKRKDCILKSFLSGTFKQQLVIVQVM